MELDACKAELIERHLDEVIEMNRKINLTRVVDRESALVLHVEDSLSAFPEFSEAPSGPYADLGSGGGFPGVTLSSHPEGRCFSLIRSGRRCVP